MLIASRALVAGLAISLSTPTAGHGQGEIVEEAVQWFLGFPSWTVELDLGLANHGRLLLQSLDGPNGVVEQRALNANNSFSWGGAVAFNILPRTAARLGLTRTSTDLKYEDDTGTGSDALDIDDVADLSSTILSLSVMRFLLPERIKFTPYGAVGVAMTWWNLDETSLIEAGGSGEGQTRFTGVGVVGLQYRFSSDWAVRLDATTYSIGNPFSGKDSYIPTTGFTTTELTRVRQTHFRVAIAYTFGRPGLPSAQNGGQQQQQR